MKKIQGILFDEQLNTYRKESFRTKSQLIDIVETLVSYTVSDEEPYVESVRTDKQLKAFLEQYNYRVTYLTDKQLSSFESIMEQSELIANRLSLEEANSFNEILTASPNNNRA